LSKINPIQIDSLVFPQACVNARDLCDTKFSAHGWVKVSCNVAPGERLSIHLVAQIGSAVPSFIRRFLSLCGRNDRPIDSARRPPSRYSRRSRTGWPCRRKIWLSEKYLWPHLRFPIAEHGTYVCVIYVCLFRSGVDIVAVVDQVRKCPGILEMTSKKYGDP
jgi:hypothetical protein